jgi:hypothetical protein
LNVETPARVALVANPARRLWPEYPAGSNPAEAIRSRRINATASPDSFWTAALFFGAGLYAESNAVVLAALTLGALSLAFAVFLILGMGEPYTGMIKVNPAALRETIEFLGK